VHQKKWEAIPRGTKFVVAVLFSAMLLLGFINRVKDSHTEVFEGIMEWDSMRTSFYPNGKCFATRYDYLGSQNASADLNLRRQQTGNPHALWVKLRGNVSVVGSDSRLGGSYNRELQSTEIIDAKPTQGCTQ
jgi:hypothetical protein